MKHPAKYLYETAVPDYEQLWEKGGAELEKVAIDGRFEEVPFFVSILPQLSTPTLKLSSTTVAGI